MRSLFFDSLHFVVGVLLAWWSTPLAALGAGGVAMAEVVREKKITKRVFVVFGIAYLFIACFVVWRDEHVSLLAEQKAHETSRQELAAEKTRDVPNLHPNIYN